MTRFKLTIEYDGTGLLGWQRQEDGATVQGYMEQAAQQFCGEEVLVQCAGRTDAGVHALGQVAHVDVPEGFTAYQVREGINFHLRGVLGKLSPIVVVEAEAVEEAFHARFSAVRRYYVYRIVNRAAPIALERFVAWRVKPALDVEAMHEAAQLLVGHHDFSSFRAAECQAKSAEKTLDFMEVVREGEVISVRTHAQSFLHHQVRNMVGSLVQVGKGDWSGADIERVLVARDRTVAAATAPACGLCLVRVEY